MPTDVNDPRVSFFFDPVKGLSSIPGSPSPGVSSFNPLAESVTSHTVSRTPKLSTDVGVLPPLSPYVGGELEKYVENFAHGNSEMESEEQRFLPLPPSGPYPQPAFQAGDLSKYTSVFEHGDEERETEEQGFMPPYSLAPPRPWDMPATFVSGRPIHPVPQGLYPYMYYSFLTGQLPPGSMSHFQSDYETGRDHWDDVHYERYYPYAEHSTIPSQTQEVPSDELWQQQPQYYSKTN